MTATQHTPAASHDKRIAFGGYSRDGANHTVGAIRDRGGPLATVRRHRRHGDADRDVLS